MNKIINRTTLFFKILAAMFYDSLFMLSIIFIGTAIILLFRGGVAIPPENILFQCYIIFLALCFYVGFWCYSGQTLGMRAWKLKLVDMHGNKILLIKGLLRFVLAFIFNLFFMVGFLWMLIDKDNQTLYDRLCKTRMITM